MTHKNLIETVVCVFFLTISFLLGVLRSLKDLVVL